MTASSSPFADVGRIQPAYAQVADHLRSLILEGRLRAGDRLPSEGEMARSFGVSRTTVREAIRVLSSHGLLVTERGVGGGTFVAELDPYHVSELFEASLSILTGTEALTMAELLESRELLEVPAAQLAATRRTDDDLAALEALVEPTRAARSLDARFEEGRRFHLALVEATGNRLLVMMTTPVFSVLEGVAARAAPQRRRRASENQDDHAAIVAAVRAGDAGRAGALMAEHLAHVRAAYVEEQDRPPRLHHR